VRGGALDHLLERRVDRQRRESQVCGLAGDALRELLAGAGNEEQGVVGLAQHRRNRRRKELHAFYDRKRRGW